MPSRNVHVDDAHRRITKQITLERLALDIKSVDGTLRPENPAHAFCPLLALIYQRMLLHRLPKSLTQIRILVRVLRPGLRGNVAPAICALNAPHITSRAAESGE